GCSRTVLSATLAPSIVFSRTRPAISLPRSSAAVRRRRASPTFSPATSAVAAIRSRASSASVPTSLLLACFCLSIVFLLLVLVVVHPLLDDRLECLGGQAD